MTDANRQTGPTAAAVHAYLQVHGITGAQAARMMYLSGSRQVRKYTGGDQPRQMDLARWFCLHAHTMLSEDQIAAIEAAMASDSAVLLDSTKGSPGHRAWYYLAARLGRLR